MSAKNGFSLIELLAVVAIASILSLTAVQVLLKSQLRGTQAEAINRLRQEGESLLDQFTYQVRNAVAAECLTGGTQLQLEAKDGGVIQYTLQDSAIASNSSQLSSGDVQANDLLFVCSDDANSKGTLVEIQFDLTSPSLDNALEDFEQSFATNVYLRSY